MSGTILTVSSRALLASCDKLGIDTQAILAGVAIQRSVIDDPDGRLSFEQTRALWEEAHRVSGDPDLALHAAEALPFGAYKVIDFLGASAASVGDAITQVSEYFHIINSAVELPIAIRGDEVSLGITCPSDPASLSRSYAEYTFAAVFLRVREATQTRFALSAVEFAFQRPPSIAEHERIFECTVRFGGPVSRMHIGREAWNKKSGRADPDLHGVLAEHAEILERSVPSEPGELLDVRKAIIEQLKGGDPSLGSVAQQLAVSKRTLQRRLQGHGLRYVDLLDDLRHGAARTYLRDRHVSMAEVAYLLGFAEQSSFNRAFRRWTGQAPNEYRKST